MKHPQEKSGSKSTGLTPNFQKVSLFFGSAKDDTCQWVSPLLEHPRGMIELTPSKTLVVSLTHVVTNRSPFTDR